jgi:26S proteasome regulatory subunit N13
MQDLSDSKDAEYAAHVNGYLADPDYEQSSYTPAAATAAAATPQGGAGSRYVSLARSKVGS